MARDPLALPDRLGAPALFRGRRCNGLAAGAEAAADDSVQPRRRDRPARARSGRPGAILSRLRLVELVPAEPQPPGDALRRVAGNGGTAVEFGRRALYAFPPSLPAPSPRRSRR